MKSKDHQKKHLEMFMRYCVITQDEHDQDNPFKKLPLEDMPHLLKMSQLFIDEDRLVIAKSRQLMVTWAFCVFHLWDAMFNNGRLNIIISKKEEAANKNLDRLKFIYRNLPTIFHTKIPAKKSPTGEWGSAGKLIFQCNDSKIITLSANPEDIRQNTASNIFFDEMAFFERAEDCYTAAMPSVRGGGSFVAVSTPGGHNFFYKLFSDRNK